MNTIKQKILVTGGAGYVGSILTEHLLSKGYQVTVLDNLMYNQNSLLHFFHNKNFRFVYGDVRNAELVKKLLPKFDFVLPLAAIVGAPACDRNPDVTKAVNEDAIKVLNKLRDPKRHKIVFPTTNSGYGITTGTEECTEESPLNPISVYGTTKVNAENDLLQSENAITLRFATAFGFSPRMRLDLLVNDFTYKAVRDKYIVLFEKDFKRNFVHVRDMARSFEHCIENFDSMNGKAYNCGLPDENLSKEELVLRIKKYVPDFYIHYAEIGTDPDKRNYIVSNERLRKTGFKWEHGLDEGIQELIRGYAMLRDNQYKNV